MRIPNKMHQTKEYTNYQDIPFGNKAWLVPLLNNASMFLSKMEVSFGEESP